MSRYLKATCNGGSWPLQKEGGCTTYLPDNEEMTVCDAAMRYKTSQTPLLIGRVYCPFNSETGIFFNY